MSSGGCRMKLEETFQVSIILASFRILLKNCCNVLILRTYVLPLEILPNLTRFAHGEYIGQIICAYLYHLWFQVSIMTSPTDANTTSNCWQKVSNFGATTQPYPERNGGRSRRMHPPCSRRGSSN